MSDTSDELMTGGNERSDGVQNETATTSNAVDALQDALMTVTSTDGRPPPRWLRLAEWRWFGLGAILIAVGVAIWIAIMGMSMGLVVVGLAAGALLLAGASPVLGAGLLRGKEEREARKLAQAAVTGSGSADSGDALPPGQLSAPQSWSRDGEIPNTGPWFLS